MAEILGALLVLVNDMKNGLILKNNLIRNFSVLINKKRTKQIIFIIK
jgi:hypothetical protein